MSVPQEDLGQHLLADKQVVARVVALAELKPGEHVLDAGAGTGALVRPAAEAVGPGGLVWAVDVDPEMLAALGRHEIPQMRVVDADVMRLPFPDRLDAVVANPPFRIAAPLVERIVAAGVPRSVLVVPRELSERLTARPGSAEYGKLTIRVGLLAKVQHHGLVSPKSFRPPPRVMCSIIRLLPRAEPMRVDADMLSRVLDTARESWQRKAKRALATLPEQLRIDSAAFQQLLADRGWADEVVSSLPPFAFGEITQHLSAAAAAARAAKDAASSS